MDANKAEKLAAAKKKLKQFQQKGGSKGSTNVSQQQIHQQGENNEQSVPVNNFSSEQEEEVKTRRDSQHEEKNSLDRNREMEFTQIIDTLTKEKNDLISSYLNSRELIEELQLKLDEEKKFVEKEKEKSVQLEKAILDQKCSREEELKNTVSILIEEKNELAVGHAQSQEMVKTLEEKMALQKKELEDTLASFTMFQSSNTGEITQLESKLTALTKEFNSITQDLNLRNQLCTDLGEELKELQMLNSNQTAELNQREAVIKELNLQIELLNVNMQQLKNAGPPTVDQSLEKMQRENGKLLEEIGDLREQIKKLGTEKDVLAQQYQQYILRLNGQIRTISSQAESLALEKRHVEATLESKNGELVELEATIAALKKDLETSAPLSLPSNDIVNKPAESHFSSQSELVFEEEVAMLQKKINEMNLNNEELAKLALEKESRIQELEIRIDRIQSELNLATANQDQHEKEKLLQAMQSDKSAASRAISQNRQLKIQLEELEKAFIQLSNDKLALTEESQTVLRQNKEMSEKLHVLEPELAHLRQQVEDLAGQRNATIYWKQELEEAHERIQALSHQNSELKKRVIWNLNQAPVPSGRKHRHDHEEVNEDNNSHSSCDSEGEVDWVPNEEHQKLLFHYGQLEQQLQRSMATVSTLTEEKQKLDHLVLQLQSETETIGEYVSLYQVQRGLLRRRAEQLSTERKQLKNRIEKLTILLPRLAPQLKKLPQWLQLQPEQNSELVANCEDDTSTSLGTSTTLPRSFDSVENTDDSLDFVATKIIDVLMEITNCSLPPPEVTTQSDPFQLEQNGHAPHENFHPCQVCSGRLMTV